MRRSPRAESEVVAAPRKKLRAELKAINDGGLTPAQIERDLEITRRAARRMAKANMPPDQLAKIRMMEARSKADFSSKIGNIVLRTGISPLEFLVREMRDPSNDKTLRVQCAAQALPYLHGKLPSETRVSATVQGSIKFETVEANKLESLTEEEFAQLCALSEKLEPRNMGDVSDVGGAE